jgi:hypothetical protein
MIHSAHWTGSFDAPRQPIFAGGAPGAPKQGRRSAVTRCFYACALVDRFEPGTERHVAEVTACASAANMG